MLSVVVLVQFSLFFASKVISDEVSKEIWVDTMRTALPTTMCRSGRFFRKCFNVSTEECAETALLATRICLHKYITQIPDTLIQPKDGAVWANIVGECAMESYHSSLAAKFIDTHECNDMNLWK